MQVTVEEFTVNIEGKCVIFPSYVYYLLERGYQVTQTQDKNSNRLLTQEIMDQDISKLLNRKIELKDVIIVDKDGKRKSAILKEDQSIHFDAGDFGQFKMYSLELLKNTNDLKVLDRYIIDFLTLHSSAKIKVR
jgi:hypothetical protein